MLAELLFILFSTRGVTVRFSHDLMCFMILRSPFDFLTIFIFFNIKQCTFPMYINKYFSHLQLKVFNKNKGLIFNKNKGLIL